MWERTCTTCSRSMDTASTRWRATVTASPAWCRSSSCCSSRGRERKSWCRRPAPGPMRSGPQGNHYPGAVLATVRVAGGAVPPLALPKRLLPVADLRRRITDRRTIVFSESADGDTFFVDGRTFDPNRIDTRVTLGAIEEWTIRNESGELHDFHIHQTHFQVTEVNHVRQRFDGYQDIVNVPVHGAVKVIIPFTDPVIVGRFVYHCHLLSHEDKGMMATIEVTP